jgi:predicted permease
VRTLGWLEVWWKDVAFAVRQLRKSTAFTAVTVLSLALGIGANTAIFTLIESSLLRPIPVKDADGLRLLTWRSFGHGWVAPNISSISPTLGVGYEQRETADGGLIHATFSPAFFREFRRAPIFDSLFAFKEVGRVTAVIDGQAERVNCFLVSGDFYRGMKVSPVIGRPIAPENDVPTPEGAVVVISYDYWTRRFARNPSVIGKKIALNEVPVTVIGVNPDYFTGIEPGASFEIWAPMNLPPAIYGGAPRNNPGEWVNGGYPMENTEAFVLPMMGRLKPGISDAHAQSELESIFQRQLDADFPGIEPAKRPHFILASGARGVDYLTERFDRPLLAVFCLAGLVLLIACANVANLLLAKSAVRQREIGLRLALGAGRWRVARQLLTEGLLLASMAGVAGVILGYVFRKTIPALLAAPWKASPFDAAFDLRVLLVSIAITFLTGILFSLAPVWQSRRVELNEVLKEGSRGTTGLSKLRFGRLLVVLQVALCVLLLTGAALCVKTFASLRNVPLGFRAEGVVLFSLDPPPLHYPADKVAPLLSDVRQQVSAIAGVESATFSSDTGGAYVGPGSKKPANIFANYTPLRKVGSHFFETMGIPILYGRSIDERDTGDGPHAAVVNQQFARRFFQQENAVGMTFNGNGVSYQIVGVCADWRTAQLRDPIRQGFYPSFAEAPRTGNVTIEVRIARGTEVAVMKQIRQTVAAIDPDLPVTEVRTAEQQVGDSLSQERFTASLAAAFGGLALILACIGLYGVMAYAIVRRTNEIGIRVALGAKPAVVARMVLRETVALAAVGIAIGIVAVLDLMPALDRALAPAYRESFSYGMKAGDPPTVIFAVLVLSAAGVLAGYLPSRRASRIDPMTALRHD